MASIIGRLFTTINNNGKRGGGGGGSLLFLRQHRHRHGRYCYDYYYCRCRRSRKSTLLFYRIIVFLMILYLLSLFYSFTLLVTIIDDNDEITTTSISNKNNNNRLFPPLHQRRSSHHHHEQDPSKQEENDADEDDHHHQQQPEWIIQNWNKHVEKLQSHWSQLIIQERQKKNNDDHHHHHSSSTFLSNIATITAYIESPPKDDMPSLLPLRTQSPKELRKVTYKTINSCHKNNNIPSLLPIDRGLQFNNNNSSTSTAIPWNIGDDPTTPSDYVENQLQYYCPVDADPYLPWIHDVFWDVSTNKVEFIAQNKPCCKTGSEHTNDLKRLEPQVALLQSVPIEIITEENAYKLAPELWQSSSSSHEKKKKNTTFIRRQRYRLAPYEEANVNETRFICKFHTWDIIMSTTTTSGMPADDDGNNNNNNNVRRIDLGETLSEYPFNYEIVDFRKNTRNLGLLSREGKKDNGKFWTSTLMFSCPIPKGIIAPSKQQQQQQQIVVDTTTATTTTTDSSLLPPLLPPVLLVDIIPIRTPPRYPIKTETKNNLSGGKPNNNDDAGFYFHKDWVGPSNVGQFDPKKAWGTRHVLPEIEASGRWENIPVCPLEEEEYKMVYAKNEERSTSGEIGAAKDSINLQNEVKKKKKPHLLSACLWAAASFRTRGTTKKLTTDTKDRLKEWIEFHLMVGFDHIYVYDNSAAHTNETNLGDVTDLYPPQKVTRIDWPSVVCNNNIPAHDNTGERSSQYAAENSCRVRYRHKTEFIAVFDTDEYLVPMGNHTTLRTVVENVIKDNTQILSFRSTRGKLRYSASEPAERNGRRMKQNITYLEAYNCDSAKAPKPEHGDRARKQLFRADYVLNHFVHYSTVTQAYMTQYKDNPKGWSRMDVHHRPPTERVVDEIHEATMIHTKQIDLGQTSNYRKRCNVGFKKKWLGCYIGYPWPDGIEVDGLNQTDGTQYNCFVNEKVETYFLPKLREAMKKKKKKA